MPVVWNEAKFGTGVPQIDAQHREMFTLANELLDAVERQRPVGQIRSLMSALHEHAARHFRCEEDLMERRNCTACTANRLAHKWFLLDFGELEAVLGREGVTEHLADEIEEKICQWLESHLLAIDISLRGSAGSEDGDHPGEGPAPGESG